MAWRFPRLGSSPPTVRTLIRSIAPYRHTQLSGAFCTILHHQSVLVAGEGDREAAARRDAHDDRSAVTAEPESYLFRTARTGTCPQEGTRHSEVFEANRWRGRTEPFAYSIVPKRAGAGCARAETVWPPRHQFLQVQVGGLRGRHGCQRRRQIRCRIPPLM